MFYYKILRKVPNMAFCQCILVKLLKTDMIFIQNYLFKKDRKNDTKYVLTIQKI